ncbi:hypothetical protein ACFFHJ_28910 [Planotetraspora thailandica]|uniref:hypothetical protein n=1 Tax=Planotetraspora thailandica TaxID=487172 RepID=UPI0019511E5E|nr:hypothetical protein [Planotetraspora thailandica]
MPLAIYATGSPQGTAELVRTGGTLGVLGTPDGHDVIPTLSIHRRALTVVGMHELADHHPRRYQATYTEVVTWLCGQVTPRQLDTWCRIVPGHLAPSVFASLAGPDRPEEPVIIFSWEA